MKSETFNFRLAEELLSGRKAWEELRSVIAGVNRERILGIHSTFHDLPIKRPAGGQSAINRLFDNDLRALGWLPQPFLFTETSDRYRRWKMDFIKDSIGVEVVFNHAEAIPWAFTRLNLAGESKEVLPGSHIEVGVAVFACDSLKTWARMDSAVGTFEMARAWLGLMKPILPIPLLVIGLDASGWAPTDEFRGTRKGGRKATGYDLPPRERLIDPDLD